MTKPREMLAKQIRRLGKSGTLHSVRRLAFALISGDFRNVPPIAQHALPAGQAGVITAYVAHLGLDKDRLMAATALIYVASGAFLLGALALQGAMTGQALAASSLAAVPVLAGTIPGDRLRRHAGETLFTKILLSFLLLLGLNMLRRAI